MISPEGLSVPALLDAAAAADDRAAAVFPDGRASVTQAPRMTRTAAPAESA